MTAHDFVPPMIRGVTASKLFLPALQPAPQRLYDYLCQQFAHISAQEWQQRFQDQLIYAADGTILSLDSAYLANQHIYYYRFLAHEIHVPFQHHILYETDDLYIVDKPHFLTMSPTGQYVQETLLVRLKNQMGNADLTPIHRLDRETAGLVLFSKRPATRGIYQQMFAHREVKKTYHAIAAYHSTLEFPRTVCLRMDKGQPFYTMKIVDGEPNSETQIDILEHNSQWAKYLLQPETGKQHQLRVHLNHLGITIKNDPLYPIVQHKSDDDFSNPLQLLAKRIQFIDPVTNKSMDFSSNFELTL
ncbi:pseudouridine synthase [Acinetobacter tandoii]|uniref:tRNA pseudouridine32 synthase/23S rRNA pseudouridine746 synthase n=1 Tax=Acinetobacter tandoii DSM 14970 = CIP 107469 TaxID=1120927 RepID=R9AUF9_9GAMM|nr:pseudouridine synthase [Acinetobacter tandoii]EOR05813.1 tRNA pseudouridine32 synthase/23S rRNA pseudouridine746 synthase [Acinetobacter tandoii DSM 14970 = CIP 107469]